jgi:multidrug efflux pump
MQLTLLATAFLVMVVVFAFRRMVPTSPRCVGAAGAGHLRRMWLAGFRSTTVADGARDLGRLRGRRRHRHDRDMYRNLEHGLALLAAALEGAKQIGFTVLSISLSLIARFAADFRGTDRRPSAA